VFGVEMTEPVKPARTKKVATRKTSTHKKAVKKMSVKKASAVKKKAKAFTPTAAAVIRLRKRFNMNASQFAALVGVTPPTVSNWENGSGRLILRQRTLNALTQVAELTSEQAMRKLTSKDRDK
jgi:DNA-binding transcriptional regulator YiaG